jgi:hypothetical protein
MSNIVDVPYLLDQDEKYIEDGVNILCMVSFADPVLRCFLDPSILIQDISSLIPDPTHIP